jgi:hypothetical protein
MNETHRCIMYSYALVQNVCFCGFLLMITNYSKIDIVANIFKILISVTYNLFIFCHDKDKNENLNFYLYYFNCLLFQ